MIGLHGEKRPANPIANAVHVAKLATGEAEEQYVDTTKQAGGRQGGQARAGALTPEQRHQIAKDGAAARLGRALPLGSLESPRYLRTVFRLTPSSRAICRIDSPTIARRLVFHGWV